MWLVSFANLILSFSSCPIFFVFIISLVVKSAYLTPTKKLSTKIVNHKNGKFVNVETKFLFFVHCTTNNNVVQSNNVPSS